MNEVSVNFICLFSIHVYVFDASDTFTLTSKPSKVVLPFLTRFMALRQNFRIPA